MTGHYLAIMGLAAAPDGSGYHRMYLPYKHLALNSRHQVRIPPAGTEWPMPTPDAMQDIDVLAMQRPSGPVSARVWGMLEGNVARVYEIDDDLMMAESSALPHMHDTKTLESIYWMIGQAEMVTMPSPYMAEKYAVFNSNIKVLPNFINAELLKVQRLHRPGITIGWAGGPSHLMDMLSVQAALQEVLDAHPGVELHFIGSDYSPLLTGNCRWTNWNEDVWAYYQAIDFDIGIAPLADIPFNYSKTYLKAMDYAALGIPVIATDLHPYRDFVRSGETGYLVSSHAGWVARLTELISDAEARQEMGMKARELAAQYTIQGNWQLWEKAYEEAAR